MYKAAAEAAAEAVPEAAGWGIAIVPFTLAQPLPDCRGLREESFSEGGNMQAGHPHPGSASARLSRLLPLLNRALLEGMTGRCCSPCAAAPAAVASVGRLALGANKLRLALACVRAAAAQHSNNIKQCMGRGKGGRQ